ncbi:MAG: penicillin acylase family protein [Sphingomonadaceae bacterium]|uniref:penicillin acylase family protein n=1 Tax=Thermaurantiacus sp. TaxID=2820283 RepID=UPI00298EFF0A|nr:penicillin acylase family protein [Thermaurantiacus sp.]MCS6987235.1 penicillin acylase family protein [Sphingomonadaceae bacterium]MDW8414455.1 penicillin acylase family protein [Thermaurantiacus sp.]
MHAGGRARRAVLKRGLRALALVAGLLVLSGGLWVASWWRAMDRSLPRAEGRIALAGLTAPVVIARDAAGVPVIRGANRQDVAFALGFLHGQERFFQMDLLRRAAAGELAELLGPVALPLDRRVRVHRFRARAHAIVARGTAAERRLLDAYVAGVNAGLNDLGGPPFEYRFLLTRPKPWAPEDTVLTVFAMYLNLQPLVPERELDRAHAETRLGPGWADFLFPASTWLDAPLDGSTLPASPLPRGLMAHRDPPAGPAEVPAEAGRPVAGSNNWAVAGPLSTTGAALVANDMHLGLSVPGTWYRARLQVMGAPTLDATGVTLPGSPFVVAGSTGRIAWGFTNSYIDTADAVVVEETRPGFYRTPDGERPFRTFRERIGHRLGSVTLDVRETVWGPVVGQDARGRPIAMIWTAHRPDAVKLEPFLALEQAAGVDEAIAIAHRAAIPQQNFVVGDREGRIAWTIIGQVPDRFGFDGRDAVSFADGTRGWRGLLGPEAIPVVRNPPSGRIWTANARVVGGNAYALLGDGGYDIGARARRIRDLLFAAERFAPADFLRIQLDDVNLREAWWQRRLLAELQARSGRAELVRLVPFVRAWGGRAVPESVGYRLVARFRALTVERLYAAYLGKPEGRLFRRTYAPPQADGAVRRLLEARPAALVPPGHASWGAFMDDVLEALAEDVAEAGGARRFAWGEVGRAGVRHPLSRLFPPLGWLTDPRDAPVPGDRATVRAQAPGFGASERFAVSPGHEARGLFHMGGSPSGNPRAPWYLAGHRDWLEGRPAPFLPGPPRWTLVLVPHP